MKEEIIVRYTRDNLPKDNQTDWARVDAMTDEEIEEAARSDPDAQLTDADYWKNAVPVDGRNNRSRLNIDPDILHWFQNQGKDYRERMSAILKSHAETRRDSR
jgi:uncharacterized protein (DUF4415 family)